MFKICKIIAFVNKMTKIGKFLLNDKKYQTRNVAYIVDLEFTSLIFSFAKLILS